MFAILKPGLVIKKNEKKEIDYQIFCCKLDHTENPINLICFEPSCVNRGAICVDCYFQEHLNHSSKCCTLKEFIKKYKKIISNSDLQEVNEKAVENEVNDISKEFQKISAEMNKLEDYCEEFNLMNEKNIKKKQNDTLQSYKRKNVSEYMEIINCIEQNSFSNLNFLNESIFFLLNILSVTPDQDLANEKIENSQSHQVNVYDSKIISKSISREISKVKRFLEKQRNKIERILFQKPIENKGLDSLLTIETISLISQFISLDFNHSNIFPIYDSCKHGFEKERFLSKTKDFKKCMIFIESTKNNIFTLFLDDGIKSSNEFSFDASYMIISINEKKLLKKGRCWGPCYCPNYEEQVLFTSSNLHEIEVFVNCNLREDNRICMGNKKEECLFKVKKIEVYSVVFLEKHEEICEEEGSSYLDETINSIN